MKKIFQFALVAFAAAAVVVACQKPPQEEQKPGEEQQKPGDDYTGPVQGTSAWSVIGALLDKNWDTDFVCAEENGAFVLKNVKLAKDNQIKFRKDKGWDENRGINEPDKHAELAAGTPTKAVPGGGNIIIPADGIYDLYYFAEKEAIVYVAKGSALPEIPDFAEETPEPQPEGLVMDGDPSDWAELDAADVVSLVLPEGAEKTWLKSAKAYYDDKLYLLLEISDEAIASNKVRMHVYLDADATGKFKQNGWTKSSIDYATEGKIVDGGFCAYSSKLYSTPEEGWKTVDTGFSPKCEGTGKDNLYELSLDFTGATAEIPVAFNIGLDVADTDYNISGFLPVADKMARIVKVGATDPGEEEEPAALSVTDFVKFEKGAEGTFEGIIAAKGKNGLVVTDGTTNLYAFKPTGECNVGDKVSIKGNKDVYYGLAQVAQGGVITVISSGNDVPATEAIDINATFDAYPDNASVSDFVTFQGKLTVSGSNTNVAVEGATSRTGSLEGLDFAAYANKDVVVTGYYIGTAGKDGMYLKVIATSIEEIVAPAVTLDGKFEDWGDIDAIANSGSIKEWKYTSDANNVYFYFKIERSDIKAGHNADDTGKFPFADRRYIYIGLDTDNNSATGDKPTSGDMTITGCEVLALVYPFRGYSESDSGTDGAEVINGEDEKSWIKIPAAGSKTGDHLAIYGIIEEDFGYLEMAMPKAKIGSPAAGKWKVQFSLSSNLTGKDQGGDEIVIE